MELTMEIGVRAKGMEMVHSLILMEHIIRDSGLIIRLMVIVFILFQT